MTDRDKCIRKALEDLRERCAQEAVRITARRRVVASMISNHTVKPSEVAAAIRKIDVQQYYECAAREIEALRAEVEEWKRVAAAQAELHDEAEECAERLAEALAGLITWIPSADTYRRIGFDPAAPMRALERAQRALGRGGLREVTSYAMP